MTEKMTDKELMPHKQPLKPEDIIWLEKFIHDQCNGVRQWTMCVPVQDDDSDMVLCRILNHLKSDTRQTPAPVDLDELKREVLKEYGGNGIVERSRLEDMEWVIDHLAATGRLLTKGGE